MGVDLSQENRKTPSEKLLVSAILERRRTDLVDLTRIDVTQRTRRETGNEIAGERSGAI
jgi:hypothetical protein